MFNFKWIVKFKEKVKEENLGWINYTFKIVDTKKVGIGADEPNRTNSGRLRRHSWESKDELDDGTSRMTGKKPEEARTIPDNWTKIQTNRKKIRTKIHTNSTQIQISKKVKKINKKFLWDLVSRESSVRHPVHPVFFLSYYSYIRLSSDSSAPYLLFLYFIPINSRIIRIYW